MFIRNNIDVLEKLVLENSLQRTSQHVKWKSGAPILISVFKSINALENNAIQIRASSHAPDSLAAEE